MTVITKFLIFTGIFCTSACATLKSASASEAINNELYLNAICYQNVMPMTNSKPYMLITICPSDKVLHENIRVMEIVVNGKSAADTTQQADRTFRGKGLSEYQHTVRNINLESGSGIAVTVVIGFESGTKKSYTLANVPLQVVH